VKRYLVKHPENRHFGASVLVAAALAETFPCKSVSAGASAADDLSERVANLIADFSNFSMLGKCGTTAQVTEFCAIAGRSMDELQGLGWCMTAKKTADGGVGPLWGHCKSR
jgi:hypothetical protein